MQGHCPCCGAAIDLDDVDLTLMATALVMVPCPADDCDEAINSPRQLDGAGGAA